MIAPPTAPLKLFSNFCFLLLLDSWVNMVSWKNKTHQHSAEDPRKMCTFWLILTRFRLHLQKDVSANFSRVDIAISCRSFRSETSCGLKISNNKKRAKMQCEMIHAYFCGLLILNFCFFVRKIQSEARGRQTRQNIESNNNCVRWRPACRRRRSITIKKKSSVRTDVQVRHL